jgi:hypothetical protein
VGRPRIVVLYSDGIERDCEPEINRLLRDLSVRRIGWRCWPRWNGRLEPIRAKRLSGRCHAALAPLIAGGYDLRGNSSTAIIKPHQFVFMDTNKFIGHEDPNTSKALPRARWKVEFL